MNFSEFELPYEVQQGIEHVGFTACTAVQEAVIPRAVRGEDVAAQAQTGTVLPDGQTGELVLTSLTKIGMPVIRFRTRDLTRLLPGAARSMRRMARVTGRSDDMLIIRGVNVFPSQIEEIVVQQASLSPHYVLEVRRESHLDELDVVVERRPEIPGPLSVAARSGVEHEVERLIKGLIGVSTKVRVVEPETLQRSQGKAVRVIDKRPKN